MKTKRLKPERKQFFHENQNDITNKNEENNHISNKKWKHTKFTINTIVYVKPEVSKMNISGVIDHLWQKEQLLPLHKDYLGFHAYYWSTHA